MFCIWDFHCSVQSAKFINIFFWLSAGFQVIRISPSVAYDVMTTAFEGGKRRTSPTEIFHAISGPAHCVIPLERLICFWATDPPPPGVQPSAKEFHELFESNGICIATLPISGRVGHFPLSIKPVSHPNPEWPPFQHWKLPGRRSRASGRLPRHGPGGGSTRRPGCSSACPESPCAAAPASVRQPAGCAPCPAAGTPASDAGVTPAYSFTQVNICLAQAQLRRLVWTRSGYASVIIFLFFTTQNVANFHFLHFFWEGCIDAKIQHVIFGLGVLVEEYFHTNTKN